MIAADTNVVVRLLTADDPDQARRAAELFETEAVWLPKTVILETEWVLRYAYKLDPATVGGAFTKLFGLPRVEVEDMEAVRQALGWHGQGLDFADALHLGSSRSLRGLATFDEDLAKRTKRHKIQGVVLL